MPVRAIKYCGLVLGLILFHLSNLFFALDHSVFELLFVSGLLLACFSLITLLFGRSAVRIKLMLLLITAVCLLSVTETGKPAVYFSARMYLWKHHPQLDSINKILIHTPATLVILNGKTGSTGETLDSVNKSALERLTKQTGAYLVTKTAKDIHYGLFGFLDVRRGLVYSFSGKPPKEGIRLLEEHWYWD